MAMPNFSFRRRRFRRRTTHRNKFRRNADGFSRGNKSLSRLNPRGIPNGYQTAGALVKTLRYPFNQGEGHGITSTLGVPQAYIYRSNSCYDPYYGAGGVYPDGFTHYMATYNRFVVLGSKITVHFQSYDMSTPTQLLEVAIMPSHTSTAVTTAQIGASMLTKRAVLNADQRKVTLTAKYSYKQTGARSPFDNNELEGNIGADCGDQWFYHIFGHAYNAQTCSCWFTGYIDYIIMFVDPRLIGR